MERDARTLEEDYVTAEEEEIAAPSGGTAISMQQGASVSQAALAHTAETVARTAASVSADAAVAAASNVGDEHAPSEAFDSTLMGIALLAFLQSSAKNEASDGEHASAPSTSKCATTDRVPLERTSLQIPAAGARPSPSERVPRRYQKMSSNDEYALADPLIWTLASIKSRESIAQYTCKR